ncbi:DUF192 domain-containing protein, partial [Ilumatobacter sp.]|uniref:DUF192 domain-containing protein n=1 Tax=Ilumatobacter sp. TaxID=1967498 RepID=UPI003C34A8F9
MSVADPEPTASTAISAAPTTVAVTVEDSSIPESTGVQPEGFTTVQARVTSADGEVCEVCLWLADTDAERSRGLMGVTDLGDAVGMVFTWEAPVSSRFVMIGTPTPLSIAWFADDGSYVSGADMEPCVDGDPSACARYAATGEYTAAIEMFQGELDAIGIGPGA